MQREERVVLVRKRLAQLISWNSERGLGGGKQVDAGKRNKLAPKQTGEVPEGKRLGATPSVVEAAHSNRARLSGYECVIVLDPKASGAGWLVAAKASRSLKGGCASRIVGETLGVGAYTVGGSHWASLWSTRGLLNV